AAMADVPARCRRRAGQSERITCQEPRVEEALARVGEGDPRLVIGERPQDAEAVIDLAGLREEALGDDRRLQSDELRRAARGAGLVAEAGVGVERDDGFLGQRETVSARGPAEGDGGPVDEVPAA